MAMTDHRTTRPLLAVATIGAVCFALTGCGGGDSPTVAPPSSTATSAATASPSTDAGSPSTDPSSESSESSSTTSESSSSSATTATFKVGQCIGDTIDWATAPCGQPHKMEIMAVVKTTKDANDIIKRGRLRTWTCNNELAGYLGSPSAGFSRILAQPVPAASDPKANQEIVCAAASVKGDDSGYEEISYPLKNRIKKVGYTPYRICTSDRPSKTDSPKIVPCTDRHKAETIGGYVIGKADGKPPTSKAVDKLALGKCVPLAKTYLGGTRGDVIAAANSTGSAGWKRGTTMTACFVEATKGTFSKPLKGMKNKPLSQYQ